MEKEHQTEPMINEDAAATATGATDGEKVVRIVEPPIEVLEDKKNKKKEKKAKTEGKGFGQFFYDSKRKTVLGKDGLGWGK